MGARPCNCCGPVPVTYFNLMKLNPATGAVVWRAFVPGNGVGTPGIGQIEALHGTNDIVARVDNTGGSTLCRVDSTGVQQWFLTGYPTAGGGPNQFGVSSAGAIVARLATGNDVRGLNGSGATLWTTTFVGTVLNVCVNGTYAIVGENTGPSWSNRITASSGAVAWRLASVGPYVVDNANGFLSLSGGSLARFDSTTNGLLASTPGAPPSSFSFGGSGYSLGSTNSVRGTAGTSLTSAFFLSSISGASLTGKGNGPNCNDSSRYYFGTSELTGTGSVKFNIYAVNSSGTLVWIQKWGGTGFVGSVFGMCVADDGFIYASGNYIHV